jgi:tetratricopeptide (TPR) repeat protein
MSDTDDRKSKAREAAALEQLIRTERTAAREVVGEMLTGPSAWWNTRIFGDPEALTYGFAVELVERAVALLNTAPADAVEAARIAVEVGERLRVDAYPHDFVIGARANAYREYAYALFYIGRLNEAETAVNAAEQLFRQMPVPDIELARTALIRSVLLFARDRIAEAIPLAEQAGRLFADFGERPRYVKARMTEATLRYRGGDLRGALAIWLALENEPVELGETFGLLLHNIGHAYRDLNEFTEARAYLERATTVYAEYGMHAEKVRTRWVVGQLLVLTGQMPAGLRVLQTARKEFEQLGMELDAALVGLELAEALLVDGQIDQVAQICRTILDRFVRERMVSRAITALAYLREAVAAEKATPAMVRDVREFLRTLPPGAAVSPPPLL